MADEGPVRRRPECAGADRRWRRGSREAAFRRCTSCHTPEEGGANRVGPNLWNTVMQPIANADGFKTTPPPCAIFAAAEETWTYEHLAGFLADPRGYLPGTTMSFAGIRDVQEKADLIAYLRTLSSDPAAAAGSRGKVAAEEDIDPAAEPVEPTPSTDGTEASPETDAGVPASELGHRRAHAGTARLKSRLLPLSLKPVRPKPAKRKFLSPRPASPKRFKPDTDETETEVEVEPVLEERSAAITNLSLRHHQKAGFARLFFARGVGTNSFRPGFSSPADPLRCGR